jgi:hypothetical protein
MTRLLSVLATALALEIALELARRIARRKPAAPVPHEHREADDGGGWRPIDPASGKLGEPVGPPVPWLYKHRRDRWPVRWP